MATKEERRHAVRRADDQLPAELGLISNALVPQLRAPFMLLVVLAAVAVSFFWVWSAIERYVDTKVETRVAAQAIISHDALVAATAASKEKNEQYETLLKEHAERLHAAEQAAAATGIALVQINAGIAAVQKDVSNVENHVGNVESEVRRMRK